MDKGEPKQKKRGSPRTAHTVNFGSLYDQIDGHEDSLAWKHLPIAGKIRVLVESGLMQGSKAFQQELASLKSFLKSLIGRQEPETSDLILAAHLLEVTVEDLEGLAGAVLGKEASPTDAPTSFLIALMRGRRPADESILSTAKALNISTKELYQLIEAVLNGNAEPHVSS